MQTRNYFLVTSIIILFAVSCTSVKLAVPSQFASQAESMHVKGLQGFTFNQKISFGKYQSSRVKNGWVFSTSRNDKNAGITVEERVMKVFDLNKTNISTTKRNKYQFELTDGNLLTEVYCMEKLTREELKMDLPVLGEISRTKNFQYSFSSAIIPIATKDNDPWQLVFYNNYDRSKDTARRLLDLPYVEEEGFLTNGKETITIRPVRVKKSVDKNNREYNMPIKMLMGYEFRIDDGVVGITDLLDNNIWLYKDMDDQTKLIVASAATAIMLRKQSAQD